MALQQSGNLLAKGLPPTAQDLADQPPHAQVDDDREGVDRHVHYRPLVMPVHLRRRRSAHRTWHRHIPGAGRDHHCMTPIHHVLNDQDR